MRPILLTDYGLYESLMQLMVNNLTQLLFIFSASQFILIILSICKSQLPMSATSLIADVGAFIIVVIGGVIGLVALTVITIITIIVWHRQSFSYHRMCKYKAHGKPICFCWLYVVIYRCNLLSAFKTSLFMN